MLQDGNKSEHRFAYQVQEAESGQTIEWFLKKRGYSRQILTQLKKTDQGIRKKGTWAYIIAVSYTHLRANETSHDIVLHRSHY